MLLTQWREKRREERGHAPWDTVKCRDKPRASIAQSPGGGAPPAAACSSPKPGGGGCPGQPPPASVRVRPAPASVSGYPSRAMWDRRVMRETEGSAKAARISARVAAEAERFAAAAGRAGGGAAAGGACAGVARNRRGVRPCDLVVRE